MQNHGFAQVESFHERRLEARGATVFRPVLIETEDFAGFCLVRNLSANGLMGKVYAEFAVGQPIVVQFMRDELVKGELVWCQQKHIGILFTHPIDVAQVLASLARKEIDGWTNRPLRLPMHCAAEVIVEGRRHPAQVQDISMRGLKIRNSFVKVGEDLTVTLEGLGSKKALVRWCQAGMAGLSFLQPFAFDELAEWVVKRQMGDDSTPNGLASLHRVSGAR